MGSVRAARERMEAAMADGGARDTYYSAISEESMEPANPTWPLVGNGNSYSQHQPQGRGGLPPQRPPRPSYVPPMEQDMGHGQSQQYSRNHTSQQQVKYWEPNYSTREPITPRTISSRDSAGSSVGSIPDFPVPAIPANTPATPKRTQNFGPPPSRRGPSSFYSQTSYVLPIPEESIELPQQRGYAARRAQVMSDEWQDDTPDSYIDRDSTISAPGDHLVEPAGLVRNASMGKQYKPSATPVRLANETLRQKIGYAAPQPTVVDRSHLAAEHTVFVESVDSDDEETIPHGRNSIEGTTFLRDASSDSDLRKEASMGEKDILASPPSSRGSSPKKRDPRIEHLMSGLEKGGAIPVGTAVPLVTETRTKPAQLDFAAEASYRASLTSLSDLIRRATRVKTNLEKGKTASRLGLLDFFSAGSKSDLLKVQKDERPRESLTDMLGAFPPPAHRNSRGLESPTEWPQPCVNNVGKPQYLSNAPPKKRKNPKGRRCCGLPLWGFILLLLLLIILVVAAVLIPIFLIALPNQARANAQCPNAFPCSNGGYSVSLANSCHCVCAAGFTGPQCTEAPLVASECTTANLDSFKSATIGAKVLPVLSGATNFSIPLNATILLANFSSAKLSCGDENNLVTFLDAGTQRRRDVSAPAPTPVAILPRQDTPDNIIRATPTGILVDTTSGVASAASTTAATKPSASQVSFAQSAILYIMQQSTIDAARSIRYALDTAFQNGNWVGPVSAGTNITVDLRRGKVSIGSASVGET